MRSIILLSLSLSLSAMDFHTDLYGFGVSRHSYHEEFSSGQKANERNPGCGVGVMLPATTVLEYGAVAGWYVDSYHRNAKFAMPMARVTGWNRVSFDVAAGYFNGSDYTGIGGLATVGVRVAGPVWLHLSGSRSKEMSMVCAFVRVRL